MARSVAPWWWTSLSANGRKRKSRSKPTFSNSPTMLGWDHFGKVYRLKAANVSAGGVRENAGRWDHQARGTPKTGRWVYPTFLLAPGAKSVSTRSGHGSIAFASVTTVVSVRAFLHRLS